jgi:hypothetical protein
MSDKQPKMKDPISLFYSNLNTTCIRTQYFRHKPLFPQQKQKEFDLEFSLHEYSKGLSPFDDLQCCDYLIIII